MNYVSKSDGYSPSKSYAEEQSQIPARSRLEDIAASVNSLACNLAATLEKVRGCGPVATDAASSRQPDSIEDWLGIIESRLKDAGYTASQLDDRL